VSRPAERWDIDGKLRFLRPARPRARSEHQAGDVEAEVLASPGYTYPPRGSASPAPEGTLIVERLFAPGAAAPLSFLVMVKPSAGPEPKGGDWDYLVVRPDGLVEDSGKIASCARCHAEAPYDGVFGGTANQ